MSDYFIAPFPFRRDLKLEIGGILAIGAFVVGFLLVYEPFGTDDFQAETRLAFLSGYGFIISGVFLLFRFLLPAFCPTCFDEQTWTVGKQVLWVFCAFASAITACYLYWGWYFGDPLSLFGWWGFAGLALSIGIFPILAIITADYIFLLRKFQSSAAAFNPQLERRAAVTEEIAVLRGNNAGEELSLPLNQLVYLSAANNYVEVVYATDKGPQQKLLRVSLAELEKQLDQAQLLRCHRSYLVNIDKLRRVSGSAQGYRIHLEGIEQSIPVSRSRANSVRAVLNLQR